VTWEFPKLRHRRRLIAAAGAVGAAAALTAAALNGFGSSAGAADVGQEYHVPCPAADLVTPALNANLIQNAGAEDFTQATDLGAPAGDANALPNCWTVSSALAAPAAVLSSAAVADVAAGASGAAGARSFFGGSNNGAPVSGASSTGTQRLDVSALHASGQPFELSASLGGVTTSSAATTVSATFEDGSGNTLGLATIGPVTAAQRGNVTGLLPRAWYGTVPKGTQQAVITVSVSSTGTSAASQALADGLSLTIGSSAVPASPVLQTVPYTAVAGSDGTLYRPAGVSAAGGTAYVSNTGVSVVSALTGGLTSTIAGSLEGFGEHGDGGPATSATVYHPGGTAVDSRGDVFIADAGDNVVREITRSGVIRRIAGTGSARGPSLAPRATSASLDYPEGVATDSRGDVFIADTDNNRVVEVTPAGSIRPVAGTGKAGYSGDGHPATHASLNMPTGVAVDARGNVYIADASSNVIRRVDARTGIITTVAGNFAADQASDGLGGFSGDGGPATSARLNDPQGVAVDGAGDLFIADTFNNAIREVKPDGTISTVVNAAGTGGAIPPAGGESSGQAPTASKLNTPYAVAVDPAGALYIADTKNNAIAEVFGLAQPGNGAGPTASAHS
jgi:NHL repeat